MIDVHALVKDYSGRRVVDGVSLMALNGCVTGLVGPNGAGKSTTLRMIVDLTRSTSGQALVSGCRYRDLGPYPLRRVGTLLDGAIPDGGRRAVDQLGWVARSNRIPRRGSKRYSALSACWGARGKESRTTPWG